MQAGALPRKHGTQGCPSLTNMDVATLTEWMVFYVFIQTLRQVGNWRKSTAMSATDR